MHMGNNPEGKSQGRVSALYVEGVAHVQRHVEGARGEQAVAIGIRLWRGLKIARRPLEFSRGVRAACREVVRVGRDQLKTDA